ncbi:MAG TPA: metal-dependent hydrolase [Candidatus Paceibacterota bacterium]|nr:metal-dependent hydrolase [Candidatus Paceibacterota bacterium]
MFREHIAVGAILSMAVVVAVYFYALLTDPLLLMILFVVTVIGSFLPDVDSDSGMPFYLIFGTATLAATGVVLLYTLASEYAGDWRVLVGIPAAAMFFFWFVVGGIIKRCTHHRGIFHSIPALAIAGVATFLVARYYGLDETIAWIFGGAMAAGFLSHLVLDDLYSGITLDGLPFISTGTTGSALKFFSDSGRVNIATYVVLAALVYTALQPPMIAEAYYNDSDVIEIGDAPPPPPEEDPETPGGGTEGGETENGNGNNPEDSGGAPGESGSSNDSGGGSGDGGSTVSGGGSGGGGGGSGSGAAGTNSAATEETVLESLIQSGAIEGLSSFQTSTSGGPGGSGSGASGRLVVVGERVREALRTRTDLQDLLTNWRNVRQTRTSARDVGLMAASTALSDANIQEIAFTADAFEITYRSRGYLLAVIPWTFPVRIQVVPQAAEGSRVTVRLPWYRFFVREFFTPQKLASDIESAMVAALTDADALDDERTLLLTAVAQLVRERVGTVGDSILLGSS